MSTADLPITCASWASDRVVREEHHGPTRTGALHVRARAGSCWRLTLRFDNLFGANLAILDAHVSGLQGTLNRSKILLATRCGYTARGAPNGTPLLQGAALTGATSVPFDGGSGSVTGYFKAGDFVTIGHQLLQVTADVNTTTGAGTLPFWPALNQNKADNTPIQVAPYAVCWLADAGPQDYAPYHNHTWLGSRVITLEEDVLA